MRAAQIDAGKRVYEVVYIAHGRGGTSARREPFHANGRQASRLAFDAAMSDRSWVPDGAFFAVLELRVYTEVLGRHGPRRIRDTVLDRRELEIAA